MNRNTSREAYNDYFRAYREKHKERIREIGRNHMRKARAEERVKKEEWIRDNKRTS